MANNDMTVGFSDLIVPVDRRATLAEIDSEYERLIARVDDHIDRLTILEQVLDAELAQQSPVESNVDPYPDWLSGYQTQAESSDEEDRHVYFDDVVLEIDSDGTVQPMYTPFDAYMGSDDDSDTETVVLDYDDPSMSPDIRFIIRHPVPADADTDSDDGY